MFGVRQALLIQSQRAAVVLRGGSSPSRTPPILIISAGTMI
jgi:hypothetical protein